MLCQMSRQGSDLGPGGLSGSEGGAGSVLRKRALTHSSSGIILLVLVVMMIGDNEELILDNVPPSHPFLVLFQIDAAFMALWLDLKPLVHFHFHLNSPRQHSLPVP